MCFFWGSAGRQFDSMTCRPEETKSRPIVPISLWLFRSSVSLASQNSFMVLFRVWMEHPNSSFDRKKLEENPSRIELNEDSLAFPEWIQSALSFRNRVKIMHKERNQRKGRRRCSKICSLFVGDFQQTFNTSCKKQQHEMLGFNKCKFASSQILSEMALCCGGSRWVEFKIGNKICSFGQLNTFST